MPAKAARSRRSSSTPAADPPAARRAKPAAGGQAQVASGVAAPAGTSADAAAAAPRERIVRAARAQFLRLGFARFTMDDLARELGMSKKTLYLHFRSKEELLDALLENKAASISAGFEEILAAPATSFTARVTRVIQHAHAQVGEISAVFLHDLRRYAPAVYGRLEGVRARVFPGVWERLLREGIASGAVRADIDVAFSARLMLTAIQALLLPENLERFGLQPTEVLVRFLNLIFFGLLTPAGRADYEKNRPSFDRLPPLR